MSKFIQFYSYWWQNWYPNSGLSGPQRPSLEWNRAGHEGGSNQSSHKVLKNKVFSCKVCIDLQKQSRLFQAWLFHQQLRRSKGPQSSGFSCPARRYGNCSRPPSPKDHPAHSVSSMRNQEFKGSFQTIRSLSFYAIKHSPWYFLKRNVSF